MARNTSKDYIAITLVPIAVLIVVGTFLMLGYLLTILFQIRPELGLPVPFRLLGAAVLIVALGLWAWLFRFRKPVDVMISTYATFRKLFHRAKLKQDSERTEPLVVRGPYKLVRHPMYLAVLLSLAGCWLLLDLSFLLLATIIALLWFNLVVIPFEEEELIALFGRDYEEYMRRVRRLVPIPRRSTSGPQR